MKTPMGTNPPKRPAPPAPARLDPFVAIDFETADYGRDSACSVALVRVESGRVREQVHRLIRPPRRDFYFTHIHRITWPMVAAEPDFGGVWAEIVPLLEGAAFLAAHNASFDRSVLRACCAAAGLPMSGLPFLCTVKLARSTWNLRPTKLPDVCRHLGLGLAHHDAASDARACADIVLAAEPHRVAAQLGG
jgi:DNA polymerase-3 subunit epsilon